MFSKYTPMRKVLSYCILPSWGWGMQREIFMDTTTILNYPADKIRMQDGIGIVFGHNNKRGGPTKKRERLRYCTVVPLYQIPSSLFRGVEIVAPG